MAPVAVTFSGQIGSHHGVDILIRHRETEGFGAEPTFILPFWKTSLGDDSEQKLGKMRK
jgi:hypothetical protein